MSPLVILGMCVMSAAPDLKPATAALVKLHGEAQRPRITQGLSQVASLWRKDDGDLTEFATAHFIADAGALAQVFERFESQLEQQDGHLLEIGREWRAPTELELGPMLGVDALFASLDHAAHVSDDLFASKLAFVALLNFPATTLEQRSSEGRAWSRAQWAQARLTGRFSRRTPAHVQQAVTAAQSAADLYVAQYNVCDAPCARREGRPALPQRQTADQPLEPEG